MNLYSKAFESKAVLAGVLKHEASAGPEGSSRRQVHGPTSREPGGGTPRSWMSATTC